MLDQTNHKIKSLFIATILLFFYLTLSLSFAESRPAFQFIPPTGIISKEKLPLRDLNLIRTKNGITYLISSDARYVFQGELVDVWNGTRIKSVKQFNALSDHINFKYLGISPEKMFTLDMGTGNADVFIFSDPNCTLCHQLLKKIQSSKLLKQNFKIHAVITPALGETSMEKSNRLAALDAKNPNAALEAFINNNYSNAETTNEQTPGIKYNLLVARALGIQNFPYIVNAGGRIHIGMPDDIHLFLFKN